MGRCEADGCETDGCRMDERHMDARWMLCSISSRGVVVSMPILQARDPRFESRWQQTFIVDVKWMRDKLMPDGCEMQVTVSDGWMRQPMSKWVND